MTSSSGIEGPAATTRQWASTARTKQQIFDAARELFNELGYERTSINDVVERSGISVGSIYHHVGGKAELFAEVVSQIVSELGRTSRQAISQASDHGITDDVELFLIGARAYIHAAWKNRSLTLVLTSDDGPPGIQELKEALSVRMISRMQGIVLGEPPSPQASSLAISALLVTGMRLASTETDEEHALAVIDYYVGLVRQLAKR